MPRLCFSLLEIQFEYGDSEMGEHSNTASNVGHERVKTAAQQVR
jgi:hypothetical protein